MSLKTESRTLHVGIDATSWRNDRGYGRFTRELVTALAARDSGFRYTLFFDQMVAESVPPGVEVVSAQSGRNLTESAVGSSSRSLGYLLQMGRLTQRSRCDVLFFPTVYSFFPVLSRVPCVICYHDATAERFPQFVFPTKLNQRLWRVKTALAKLQTTRAMTISQSSAEDVEQILRIPRERIDVITEGADSVFRVIDDPAIPAAERRRHGIPESATLLVYVGGLNPHKNLLALLRALPDVIAAQPDTHLAIVGDTSGKGFWDNVAALEEFVRRHPPLEQRVHFTGYLDDERLVALLNGAAALVFPSLWEGFGLPAVEAMSCGTPVLASRCSSLPEVVGDAGMFFDPNSSSSIADCLLKFIGDRESWPRFRERALARASLFSWEKAARLAEDSFRRCYETRR